MADARAIAAEFARVVQTGNLADMTKLTQEWGTDDVIEEWPQSGERLTKAGSMRLSRSRARSTMATGSR